MTKREYKYHLSKRLGAFFLSNENIIPCAKSLMETSGFQAWFPQQNGSVKIYNIPPK